MNMNELYQKAFDLGLEMLEFFPDELTSPLRQAAFDVGIPEGDELKAYMDWAFKKLGA